MARVLFVDREEVIRQLVVEELEEVGHKVIAYDRSDGLIQVIEDIKPDIIVTDIRLESDDAGLGALAEIRKHYPTMPIIINTSYSSYKDDMRMIAADYYVVKSADLSELKLKIVMALQGYIMETTTDELDSDSILKPIRRELVRAINAQMTPPPHFKELPEADSLINRFQTNNYLKHVSLKVVNNVYYKIFKEFQIELSTARKIALDITLGIRKGANIDIQNESVLMRYYVDHFDILSLPRFRYEVNSIVSLMVQVFSSGLVFQVDTERNPNRIIRLIEFPPEYHQSGVSILNYFGTVLRKKYPENRAKIRIEQDGLKVTMTIDPLQGEREVIEKTLTEYGLVITGNMTPEKFTEDPLLVIELKSQLRIAKAQVETQRDLIGYQRAETGKLLEMVGQGVQGMAQPPNIIVSPVINIDVDASPSAKAEVSQQFEFSPQLSFVQDGLTDLKGLLPAGSEQETVDDLQKSLQELSAENSPEEVKKSSAMAKVGKFFTDLEKAENKIGKTIKGVKRGVEIAQNLAGHYNDIAQWCGLPQVPKPFLKSE